MIVSEMWSEIPPDEPGIYLIALGEEVVETGVTCLMNGTVYIHAAHCDGFKPLDNWMELVKINEGYWTTTETNNPDKGRKISWKSSSEQTQPPLMWYKVEPPPLCYEPANKT